MHYCIKCLTFEVELCNPDFKISSAELWVWPGFPLQITRDPEGPRGPRGAPLWAGGTPIVLLPDLKEVLMGDILCGTAWRQVKKHGFWGRRAIVSTLQRRKRSELCSENVRGKILVRLRILPLMKSYKNLTPSTSILPPLYSPCSRLIQKGHVENYLSLI